jgi:decaprenyl-phosphate phosphoribosyltransferase
VTEADAGEADDAERHYGSPSPVGTGVMSSSVAGTGAVPSSAVGTGAVSSGMAGEGAVSSSAVGSGIVPPTAGSNGVTPPTAGTNAGVQPAAGLSPAIAHRSLLAAIVSTARPRQWSKNVLVLAAPGAAGVLGHARPLGQSLIAFALFCLAASGCYFINDAYDVEADRHHPIKCHRAIAAGDLSPVLAIAIGIVAMVVSVATAAVVSHPELSLVLGLYVGVTLAYSWWLKHQPIFDIAAVASGFVLRAIAGGVATHVPLSNWFLIVASSGALLMVTGKRYAEHVELGEGRGSHRVTLSAYSLPFLRYVRSVSSSIAMTAYFLWAFDKAHEAGQGGIWLQISVVPFALGILRYALLLDSGHGGAPEEVILHDRTLQILGLTLAGLFAIGVYIT